MISKRSRRKLVTSASGRAKKMDAKTGDRLAREKLRELVLHIAHQSQDDPAFGSTKLNKILFFADFIAYRKHGRSITNAEYQKLEFGPAPRIIKPLLEDMIENEAIVEQVVDRFGYRQKRIVPLKFPNLDDFTAEQIAVVDQIIMLLRQKNAKDVSDLSHDFIGWKLARFGETIPYGVALVRRREPTETERAHGLSLKEEAEACLAR